MNAEVTLAVIGMPMKYKGTDKGIIILSLLSTLHTVLAATRLVPIVLIDTCYYSVIIVLTQTDHRYYDHDRK